MVTYLLCTNIPSIRIQNTKNTVSCHNLASHVPHCWWWEPEWPLTPQTRRLVGACPSTLLPCRHVLERERETETEIGEKKTFSTNWRIIMQTLSYTWREFLICTLLPGFCKANLEQWQWWAGQFLGEHRQSHWCSSSLWLLPSESESALPAHNVERPWWYDLDHCEYGCVMHVYMCGCMCVEEGEDGCRFCVRKLLGPYFSIQLALSAASARVAAQ